jgi:hypothetical protein
MWRTPDGNRALTEAEWAVFRLGLDYLWGFIEDELKGEAGLSETGVGVFDDLQPEQKLALLADVAQALRDPALPAPRHTAANEGAVAAVFAMVRQALEQEVLFADDKTTPSHEARSLLLAAAADAERPPEGLPALAVRDLEEWEWVLEAVQDRILWDADYEMGDVLLDQPPELSRALRSLTGIEPDYFTAVPREPDKAELVAVRRALARLVGRPAPDDAGA